MRAPTKKQTLIILATLLLLGCILFFSNHSSEPTYQGRPLTKWLEDLDPPNSKTSAAQDSEKFEAAEKAIVAIGTNGLPTLLNWLSYKDSPLKTKAHDLFDSQSLIHVSIMRAPERQYLAKVGFVLLKTNAQPAFADLVHIAKSDTSQKADVMGLLETFIFADKPPLPLLIKTLQDPRPDVREEITNMIIKFYPEEASKLQLNKTISN